MLRSAIGSYFSLTGAALAVAFITGRPGIEANIFFFHLKKLVYNDHTDFYILILSWRNYNFNKLKEKRTKHNPPESSRFEFCVSLKHSVVIEWKQTFSRFTSIWSQSWLELNKRQKSNETSRLTFAIYFNGFRRKSQIIKILPSYRT